MRWRNCLRNKERKKRRNLTQNNAVIGATSTDDGEQILDGENVFVWKLIDEPIGTLLAQLKIVFDVRSEPENVGNVGSVDDLKPRMRQKRLDKFWKTKFVCFFKFLKMKSISSWRGSNA